MQVNIAELVKETGASERVYPGKKFIRPYAQSGDHKSHCVLFDWSESSVFTLRIMPGLTGRLPDQDELKKYPISLQAPTYLTIAVEGVHNALHAHHEEEDGEEEDGKGKSSGGGRKPKKPRRVLDAADATASMRDFGSASDGAVPETGEITKFVVMGKELAKEAFATAYENLKEQLRQAKILTVDLMKGVGTIIQRVAPGGGLEAKGNETIPYKYDSERNSAMFGGMSPG